MAKSGFKVTGNGPMRKDAMRITLTSTVTFDTGNATFVASAARRRRVGPGHSANSSAITSTLPVARARHHRQLKPRHWHPAWAFGEFLSDHKHTSPPATEAASLAPAGGPHSPQLTRGSP